MRNLLESKLLAWIAMAIVVGVILFTFQLRPVWWAFIDEFFAFMMVFSQLMAVYLMKLNTYVGKRLQFFAALFGILMVVAIIGEFIALQFVEY